MNAQTTPFNNPVLQSFFTPMFARSSAHVASVAKFSVWLSQAHPDVYAKIAQQHPELLVPTQLVASGQLAARGAKLSGLSVYDESDTTYDYDQTTSAAPTYVATNWGADISSFISQVSGATLQAKAQNALLNTNIARAEQGLPPLTMNPSTMVGNANGGLMLLLLGGLFLAAAN